MRYWLLKSEPETYSFAQLQKDKRTNWNGVRNFQARNFIREIAKGDLCLIYHSGDHKAVVGVARALGAPYADPDAEKAGEWLQIDLAPVEAWPEPVTLKQIKTTKALATIPLIKQSRLSVMPVTEAHYQTLRKLGGA
jgi:predicted RNA-binding protein with PUA-like domain